MEFTADPGAKMYFGEIAIVGNKSVDDRIVRREFLYRPGELFRRSVLQQSQRRLTDLELFRFATIQVQQPGQDPAAVPTRVVVAEGKPRRVNFSAGYGTEEKARGEVQWHHYNFMGGARTAGVNAKWSSLDRGVRMEFNQPYLFSPRYSLGLEAHRWYNNEPAFRLTSSGARLTVNYRDQRYFNWSLGYVNEYEESRISQAALNNPSLRNDLIALGLDPQSGSQNGTLSAVSLELQRNTANSPVNATTGSFVSAHVEQAAHVLTGTFAYTNFSIEARHYLSIGSRIVMAGRVRYGAIRPFGNRVSEVPFFKRYFLGGSDSLRGWGRYEVSPLSGSGLPIGGLTMVEGTTEVRFAVARQPGSRGLSRCGQRVGGSVARQAGDAQIRRWSGPSLSDPRRSDPGGSRLPAEPAPQPARQGEPADAALANPLQHRAGVLVDCLAQGESGGAGRVTANGRPPARRRLRFGLGRASSSEDQVQWKRHAWRFPRSGPS